MFQYKKELNIFISKIIMLHIQLVMVIQSLKHTLVHKLKNIRR